LIYFLDSSALAKRYLAEPGSYRIRLLIQKRKDLAVSRISSVEIAAALSRRARQGDLGQDAARMLSQRMEEDLQAMRVVELRTPVLELAAALVWQHPLRAYDALQLGSALRLARATGLAVTFVCSDAHLCQAASEEELRVQRIG
jgi:predicted nucleic acid-binding protein